MPLNPVTGQWEDDPGKTNPGDIGAQTDAPLIPAPPRPLITADQPIVITPGQDAPAPPMPGDGSRPLVTADEPINTSAGPDAGAPPGLPDVQPYTPQPMAPIPPGRVVSPAESANLGAIDANTGARVATAQDAGAATGAAAKEKEYATARDAYANQGFQVDRQRIDDDYAKRLAAREQQAQADYQKYRDFGIKDPEADDSFATSILKAIAVGMGAYASGMNGGPNHALNIIQKANDDNIARQKAQQEKLFRIAERSGEDVKAAKEERDDAFKQLDLKHAALLDSSASMLRSQLARIGVPQAQIDANEAIQKVETDALGIRQKTLQSIRSDETDLAKADIAAAVARDKLRAKKAGAGGGGLANESKLAAYLQEKPGDMIGAYTLGAQLGMNRKAVDDALAREKEQTTATRGQVDKFASENGINAIQKQQRELIELSKALKDNEGNPVQQALAVEKAVSAARGGAASKQALALALGHLGGSLDNAEGFIEKIRSGGLGGKQLQNFEGFINGQLGASQAAGKKAYDDYNQMIADAPDTGTKARLLRDRPRLFSGMSGYAGKSEGGALAAPAAPGGGGVSVGEKAQALQWARANRGNPKADAILKALGQ